MDDLAIRVIGLGKRYRIGSRARYSTLRDWIGGLMRRPISSRRRFLGPDAGHRTEPDFIWALQDVSFDIHRGEVVGVIGRNGAGKSTLLKILSRITEPSEGVAQVFGRIGSLLEVGTGFHPELTGRENVYLNGAILGMRRQEIHRRFDAIVAFAEMNQFMDTPVKHYSSGMQMKLAFAVAAHLEPEILVIDEVLAVGDALFQRKCLGRMGEVARSGRTVLFVSHNMAAIEHLCSRVVVLSAGRVSYQGPVREGLRHYLDGLAPSSDPLVDLSQHPSRQSGKPALLRSIRLLDGDLVERQNFLCGETLIIELGVDSSAGLELPQFGIGVENALGIKVFSVATFLSPTALPPISGKAIVRCEIPEIPLVPGRYHVALSVGAGNVVLDSLEHTISFDVEAADVFGSGRTPEAFHGQVFVRSRWECVSVGGG